MIVVLLLLSLASQTVAWSKCRQSCSLACEHTSEACVTACLSACENAMPTISDPYLELEYVATLDASLEIMGSDAPSKPANANNYFVTRNGKVYRFDSDTREINVVHTINPLLLDTRNNKGLYDIAFHLDYAVQGNRKVYLHYAGVSDDPEVNHYNIIAEFRVDGMTFVHLRDIKRIPQTSDRRSGGWVSMHLKEFTGWDASGDSWLYFATGGNIDESVAAVRKVPYLSTIWGVVPERTNQGGELVNRRWASGVKNPISCDASLFTAGWFHCLLEDARGNVEVQRVQRGFNYGSQAYVAECKGENCDAERKSKPDRTAPLVTFSATECPVRSLQMYTGHKSRDYKLDKFMVRSSCYNTATNSFNKAEILRLYSDSTGYSTIAMPLKTPETLLVNTSLIGADKHDDFFVSGYSLREGRYNLYRINFMK